MALTLASLGKLIFTFPTISSFASLILLFIVENMCQCPLTSRVKQLNWVWSGTLYFFNPFFSCLDILCLKRCQSRSLPSIFSLLVQHFQSLIDWQQQVGKKLRDMLLTSDAGRVLSLGTLREVAPIRDERALCLMTIYKAPETKCIPSLSPISCLQSEGLCWNNPPPKKRGEKKKDLDILHPLHE